MVSAEDAIRTYKKLSDHGIRVWLTGGWGIDALLGIQTRPHKDLDILMLLEDVVRMRLLLEEDGYHLKELWSENRPAVDSQGLETDTAFVLQDPDGRELDAHALHFDEHGDGIPVWESDEEFIFTPQDLTGEGTIAGIAVRCISPGMQLRCHTGYELPEKQVSDLELLRGKFGVDAPL